MDGLLAVSGSPSSSSWPFKSQEVTWAGDTLTLHKTFLCQAPQLCQLLSLALGKASGSEQGGAHHHGDVTVSLQE
jgi:hypothetical protein